MLAAPVAAVADDAARISQLEAEVRQLRREIDAQSRRIERLESRLARDVGAASHAVPAAPATGARAETPAPPAGRQPWQARDAWARVRTGMTSVQVTAILGPPTAVETLGGLQSMFYRGTTADGVSLSGLVNLRDDRVVAVNPPAFPPHP